MYQILYNQETDITIDQDTMIIDQADHTIYHKTIWIEAGATLRYCLIGDASQVTLDIRHTGHGAKSYISSILIASDGSASDRYKMTSYLESAQTVSDVTMTTLLYSGAQTVIDGMIVISPGSDKASGHLHEHNIVLGSPVTIRTLPQLDIRHHDVSAGHGATLDTINDRSLFYMMSKGLDKKHATQLILSGIVETALQGYDSDEALSQLKDKIITSIISKL